MPVDTQIYQDLESDKSDPVQQVMKGLQVQNALNKIRGGMPQTQDSLCLLGAGQPYSSGSD